MKKLNKKPRKKIKLLSSHYNQKKNNWLILLYERNDEKMDTYEKLEKTLYESYLNRIISFNEYEELLQEGSKLIEENPDVMTEGVKNFFIKIGSILKKKKNKNKEENKKPSTQFTPVEVSEDVQNEYRMVKSLLKKLWKREVPKLKKASKFLPKDITIEDMYDDTMKYGLESVFGDFDIIETLGFYGKEWTDEMECKLLEVCNDGGMDEAFELAKTLTKEINNKANIHKYRVDIDVDKYEGGYSITDTTVVKESSNYISNDSVFMEKKTRDEYRIEKFKKENNFVPDKKEYISQRTGKKVIENNPTQGTITTKDGDKIKVDLNYKSKKMTVKQGTDKNNIETVNLDRQMVSELMTNDPKIHIDKRWLKVKNKKEREAIFDHEVGHIKLHGFGYLNDPDNPLFKKDSVSKGTIVELLKDIMRQSYPNLDDKNDLIASGMMDEINRMADTIIGKWSSQDIQHRQQSLGSSINSLKSKENKFLNKEKNKARSDFRKESEKYIKNQKQNPHNNSTEFEADAYATSRNGSKALGKGLDHYTKIYKKENKTKDGKVKDEYLNYTLTNAEKENIQRKKASKDMNLRAYAKKAFS